jgi:hypothetical protein
MLNPILIGGDGRGGTTLLTQMLDAHPDISMGPELHIRAVDTLDSLAFKSNASRMGFTVEQISTRLDAWPHPVKRFPDRCDFVESLLREKMHERGKTRWGFKIMRDIGIANFYDKVWTSAMYIHVIRDGRDVAASNLVFDWGYQSVLEAAYGWKGNIIKARHSAPKARYIEVKYEDLVRAPLYQMKELCKWLDIKFSYETTIPYKSGRDQPFFTSEVTHPSRQQLMDGLSAKHIGKYKNALTDKQIKTFEKVTYKMLKSFGYEVSRPDFLHSTHTLVN